MKVENGIYEVNNQVMTVDVNLAQEICRDALDQDGQVWLMNPGEAFSKEVDFLFKTFVGEGTPINKRPPNQPIQIFHTVLGHIGDTVHSASVAEIERAGLVLSTLCPRGVDIDFILAEVRAVIVELGLKQFQRYKLKDIALALQKRSHPDVITLGTEMLKLPLKFGFLVDYSHERRFSVHTLNLLKYPKENKVYKTLAIFDYIAFMTRLMQLDLETPTPQVVIIDDLYRHINADSETLKRLILNASEALKKVNGLFLILTAERDANLKSDQGVQ